MEWDSNSSIILTKDTPWNLSRSSLLWNTWVAKTQKEIGDEPFHLGSILFKTWQVTIQMGMAAWRNIYAHKRSIEQRNILIQRFKDTWFHTNCFGSHDSFNISWNLFPHILFLAQDVAYI